MSRLHFVVPIICAITTFGIMLKFVVESLDMLIHISIHKLVQITEVQWLLKTIYITSEYRWNGEAL